MTLSVESAKNWWKEQKIDLSVLLLNTGHYITTHFYKYHLKKP